MIDEKTSRKIQQSAIRLLTPRQRRESQLCIDEEPLRPGTWLGPAFQRIRIERECVLVFADDDPRANFAHRCRYLLFDPRSGEPLPSFDARFPPYVRGAPRTYRPFAGWMPRTVQVPPRVVVQPPFEPLSQPITGPGRRLAVLLCGSPEPSSLNDIEFCYRVLTQQYSFDPQDIRILYFDGKMPTGAWNTGIQVPPDKWPGDWSAYQLVASPLRSATRDEFTSALDDLDLKHNDLLFIHTTGHGDGIQGGDTYMHMPEDIPTQYTASDFRDDLMALPPFRQLIVMMAQCSSGGFMNAVVNSGCAGQISFASAAKPDARSYKTDDLLWNHFARNWFAAHHGKYPEPTSTGLIIPADTGPGGIPDQRISALEAYEYASNNKVVDPEDSPMHGFTPAPADEASLG